MFKFLNPSAAQIPVWVISAHVPEAGPTLATQQVGNQFWSLTWKALVAEEHLVPPPPELLFHPTYLQFAC